MKKILKNSVCFVLAILMVMSTMSIGLFEMTASAKDYKTGDIITFGSYPQTKVTDSSLITALNAQMLSVNNNVTYGGEKYRRVYFTEYIDFFGGTTTDINDASYQRENGYYINTVYWFKFEPLQWRVLSNTNGELYVMAEKILTARAYNESYMGVTWETCTLRSWLNIEFYNTAFNSIEKSEIKTSTLVNVNNPRYGSSGGNDTSDKLFLISYSEAINPAYGFSSIYDNDTVRKAQGTDFAKSNGLEVYSDSFCNEESSWWLRSPGKSSDGAGRVGPYGDVNDFDLFYVSNTECGVRPALKLNLSAYISPSVTTPNTTTNPTTNKLERIKLQYKPEYDEGKVTVNWGDSLFEQPSTTYNPDLALVAAALSAAATGGAEYLYGIDDYLGTYYQLGLTNAQYYNYDKPYATTLSGSNTNEHCFSIASQEITVNGEKELLVAVVLRGTESNNEIGGDAIATTSKDYYGFDYKVYNYFLDYADKVWNKFTTYVSQDWALKYDDIKVLVSGHSLGGAAANLFAARFQLDDLQHITDTRNVYAYTFGALNTVEQKAGNPLSDFYYIYNFFNHYDTFGPAGDGEDKTGLRIKPARGAITAKEKFGSVLIFSKDYKKVFLKGDKNYCNHNMPGYVDAIRKLSIDEVEGNQGNRIVILCPVDVEVYNASGDLVGRTKNNVVDESVTTVPLYVDKDAKYILLPSDSQYSLKFTAFDTGELSYYVEGFGQPEGDTAVQKSFEHVALKPDKTMSSSVGGGTDIQLFVLDESGATIAEVMADGTEQAITSADNTADDQDKIIIVIAGVIGAIILGLVVLVLMLYMRNKKKKQEQEKAKEKERPIIQPINNFAAPQLQFKLCENCGRLLNEGDRICKGCGAAQSKV